MATTRTTAIGERSSTPTAAPLRGTGFAASTRTQSIDAHELAATAAELGHRFSGLSLDAPVQAKLAVSEPGDRHEREADRVAAEIASPRSSQAEPAPAPTITPLTEATAAPEPSETVERAPLPAAKTVAPPSAPTAPEGQDAAGGDAAAPGTGPTGSAPPAGDAADDGADDGEAIAVEDRLARPRGAGHPLPATTRGLFEARLGVDFGHVRVHTDVEAARLSTQLGAVAFTHGADVYFSTGAYDPSSHEGLKLLAHELTHVVQQHGGRAAPATRMVHRSPISGATAGAMMQKLLLGANPELIVEAPLPGATREQGKELTRVGYPDLYWSNDTGNVIGVRGRSTPSGDLEYETAKLKGTRTAKGAPGKNPTPGGAGKPFKGDFPSRFKVADIKQVWAGAGVVEKIAEGMYQTNSYLDGLTDFATRAKQDKKSSVVPSGDFYKDLVIPPGIDYANFSTEIKSATPSSPNVILGTRRVWMHRAKKDGLYLIFDLDHPYKDVDYRAALENAWTQLEPVRKKLTAPQQAGGTISKKRRNVAAQRRRRVLQRKTDWAAAGKSWEDDRAKWDKDVAKPFLGSKEGKALKRRVEVDTLLGVESKLDVFVQTKEFNQIDLWSGVSGKTLGWLRFKLGPVFDKVIEFIDWAKTKLEGFLARVRGLAAKGGGWVETIMKVLLTGLKIAFRETVSLLFDMYRDCLNGIIAHVIAMFAAELSQALLDWLQKTHDGFVQWVIDVYKEFEETYKKYEDLINTVLDINSIISDIASYEKYIRLALQAIACLDPPGFGCLWGLVAQFAIGDVIDLAVDTDIFHDRVIKPLARKLLKGFLDEPFKKLIYKTMDAVGLADLAQQVQQCHPDPKEIDVEKVLTAMPAGISTSSPEFKQKKAEWEQKMMAKYGPQLLQKFSKPDGKPATMSDIERLLALLRKKKPSSDKIGDALKSATGADGKIDVEGAQDAIDPPTILVLPGEEGPGGGLSIRKNLQDELNKKRIEIGPTETGPAVKLKF